MALAEQKFIKLLNEDAYPNARLQQKGPGNQYKDGWEDEKFKDPGDYTVEKADEMLKKVTELAEGYGGKVVQTARQLNNGTYVISFEKGGANNKGESFVISASGWIKRFNAVRPNGGKDNIGSKIIRFKNFDEAIQKLDKYLDKKTVKSMRKIAGELKQKGVPGW